LYLWKQRKFRYLIAGLVLLVSIPYLMYQFVPSVNKRVDEAFWEVRMYKQGENPSGHSISQRFVYWSIAQHIFSENLLLGVGTGDIDDAFKNYYATHQTPLSKEWQFRAHNQYFTILCTFGVLGFFIFIFAFVYPFVVSFNAGNYLGIALMIIVMLSMLTEDTLETQAGATFIAFYFSLFILRRPPLDKLA